MKYFHVWVAFVAFSPLVFGQSQTIRVGKDINGIHIKLFRAKIEVVPSQTGNIELTQKILNYDHYDSSKNFIEMESGSIHRLNISTENRIIIIENRSRDIQELNLKIPPDLNLIVDVSHLGIFNVSNLNGDINLNSFKGSVNVLNAKKSLSVAIIRDGAIWVESNPEKGSVIVLSAYDGQVNLKTPMDINADLKINAEVGEVMNQSNAVLEKTESFPYQLKEDGETKVIDSYWLEGKMNSGNDIKILIKCVLGDIKLSN